MKLKLEPNDDLTEAVQTLRKVMGLVLMALVALSATLIWVASHAH